MRVQFVTGVKDFLVRQLLLYKAVKTIFNRVIGPTRQLFRKERPLAAEMIVKLQDQGVLLTCPFFLAKARVQMEHIAVAALFSIPHTQLFCDANPGLILLFARKD
jgi:hypothetical protein